MAEDDSEIVRHSKLNMASYGAGSLAREFLNMAFTAAVFFYYENEIGLNVWFVTSGLVIFAIYNMFNDPIIGYLTNRPFKFTKKWGRRFPWILISTLPWGISYFLIFTPPSIDPESGAWILFFWLLLTTCLFDTFHSLYFVNFMSLFPDKYQSNKERRLASGIYIPIGVIGVALGAMIPPMIFEFGDIGSYAIQGFWVFIIAMIAILFAIPGFREDRDTVDHYLTTFEQNPERESFFKSLRTALKQKSFISYMFIYTMYQSQITTMQNSIYYTVDHVLNMESGASTLIFAAFLIGVIVGTPFWLKYSHKVQNNKKVMLYAALLLGITTFPLLILENYWGIIITMFIWGLPLGGYWFMIFPVMADVIDESVVITGKREEGVYTGFSQFFARLGIVAQAITFGIVHTLTGFREGADTQTDLAIWGIHVHLALVPMIFIFLGCLVFWKFYKLTPEKIQYNKAKIKELNLV